MAEDNKPAQALTVEQKLESGRLKVKLNEQAAAKRNQELAVQSEFKTQNISGVQATMVPQSFSEWMMYGEFMSGAGAMTGKAFRGRPNECTALAMQAMQWGMNPFPVSQKCYIVESQKNPEPVIAYEAQLLNAVILANAPMSKRPRYKMKGEGISRQCIVTLFPSGDDPIDFEGAKIGTITTKNSPLWKSNPDQQLRYHTIRDAARVYFPDVIMGAYTREEIEYSEPLKQKTIVDQVQASQEGNDDYSLNVTIIDEEDEEDIVEEAVISPSESDAEEDEPIIETDENPSDGANQLEDEPVKDVEPEKDSIPLTDAITDDMAEWFEYLDETENTKDISKQYVKEIAKDWYKDLNDEQMEVVRDRTNARLEILQS